MNLLNVPLIVSEDQAFRCLPNLGRFTAFDKAFQEAEMCGTVRKSWHDMTTVGGIFKGVFSRMETALVYR